VDEDGGEAEAAVGGVDDEAGDGADIFVDEVLAVFGVKFREVEGAVAGGAIQTRIRQDGDGDGYGERGTTDGHRWTQIRPEGIGGVVIDGPDLGEGRGWAGDVVEALE